MKNLIQVLNKNIYQKKTTMHFTLVALLLCNGLVDRPINAGEGDDCSKGEAQVQHIGVMIEVRLNYFNIVIYIFCLF